MACACYVMTDTFLSLTSLCPYGRLTCCGWTRPSYGFCQPSAEEMRAALRIARLAHLLTIGHPSWLSLQLRAFLTLRPGAAPCSPRRSNCMILPLLSVL